MFKEANCRPLPATGHWDPAGTAPPEDKSGCLPRSRDRADHFAM